MAHITPSDLPNQALAGAHGGELATLALLKRALPSDYTIYHSIHWTNEWKASTRFGEADFLIVNRSGAVLLIEQKNGALNETAGALIKRYGDGDKDVGAQVHRSIEGIRRKFSWQHGKAGLEIDYLIYCPDHRLQGVNAVGLDASRIVDAPRSAALASIVIDLLPAGQDSEAGRRAHRFFEQTLSLAPDVHAHVTAQEKAMVRLSGGLADTIDAIEMSPLRLRVRGVPGSGKSSVAARLYRRVIDAGRRPLLVCFNRPLAERLKARLGQDGGLIETWHGLLVAFLRARGQSVDFSHGTGGDFWSRLQDRALEEPTPDDWRFDAIIVDEGQDLSLETYELLTLFARPGADFVWLEDPLQKLRDTPEVDLLTRGFVGFRARANHRSPQSIARWLREALPFEFEAANTLPGLGVGFHTYKAASEQGAIVGRLVSDLIGQGFKPAEIVVLSLKGRERATLGKAAKVGGHGLAHFTGEYDRLGNPLATPGQILFETIYRFKGGQAPAVIVTDVDPGENPAWLEMYRRLLLCAATRATVALHLVSPHGSHVGV
jgi:hypothetical protein